MTLSFSTKWPARMQSCAGQPNYFIEKIWIAVPREYFLSPDPKAIIGQDQHYYELHREKFGRSWDMVPYKEDPDDPLCTDPQFQIYPKLHTIRTGHRWKPGMKIHMVINNRTANRFQFAPVIECVSVQDIEISHTGHTPNTPLVMVHNGKQLMNPLGYEEISRLAINDGFDSAEHFFEYFNDDFEGQIIHWTSLRY